MFCGTTKRTTASIRSRPIASSSDGRAPRFRSMISRRTNWSIEAGMAARPGGSGLRSSGRLEKPGLQQNHSPSLPSRFDSAEPTESNPRQAGRATGFLSSDANRHVRSAVQATAQLHPAERRNQVRSPASQPVSSVPSAPRNSRIVPIKQTAPRGTLFVLREKSIRHAAGGINREGRLRALTADAERLRFPFPTKMLWESRNVSYLIFAGVVIVLEDTRVSS